MIEGKNVHDLIKTALSEARRPLRRTELAQRLRLSVSRVRVEVEALVAAGVVQRELRIEHGSKVFYYRLEGNPWQPRRGRYTTVLCTCGRRVILARVRLRGFENWYSMVCKGCKTMRYIHESELED